MIYDFLAPLIFMIVMLVLTCLVVYINKVALPLPRDVNKTAPYECGFQPFDTNIQQFDIKYYLVALLFLLFDVETVFLIPFISVYNSVNVFIFYNFLFFLIILFIGLFYEWKNNYLEWE